MVGAGAASARPGVPRAVPLGLVGSRAQADLGRYAGLAAGLHTIPSAASAVGREMADRARRGPLAPGEVEQIGANVLDYVLDDLENRSAVH